MKRCLSAFFVGAIAIMGVAALIFVFCGAISIQFSMFGFRIGGKTRLYHFASAVGFASGASIVAFVRKRFTGSEKSPETGLKKIHGCDNDKRIADVIFVHGLGGHRDLTWGNFPPWLGEAIPEIGVWTFGYDASPTKWQGNSMPISDRANNALEHLRNERFGNRKLIFVVHSLGGLLVKQLIRHAEGVRDPILPNIRGVVFLATPHTGSGLATILKYMRFLLPTRLALELIASSPQLRDLTGWYRGNVRRLKIQNKVFYETRGLGLFSIVSEDRSDPGLEGVAVVAADDNHVSICKPATRESMVFMGTVRFVQDCLLPEPGAPTPPRFPIPPNESFLQPVTVAPEDTVSKARKFSADRIDGAPAAHLIDQLQKENTYLKDLVKNIAALSTENQVIETIEKQGANQIELLDELMDIDFPRACETAADAETWVQQNGPRMSEQTRKAIYHQLARVELVKLKRNMPDKNLDKAKRFLDEARA